MNNISFWALVLLLFFLFFMLTLERMNFSYASFDMPNGKPFQVNDECYKFNRTANPWNWIEIKYKKRDVKIQRRSETSCNDGNDDLCVHVCIYVCLHACEMFATLIRWFDRSKCNKLSILYDSFIVIERFGCVSVSKVQCFKSIWEL